MVGKYRPKMHEYEAVLFTDENVNEVVDWMGPACYGVVRGPLGPLHIWVNKKNGQREEATAYHSWIVKNRNDEFFIVTKEQMEEFFYFSGEVLKESFNAPHL